MNNIYKFYVSGMHCSSCKIFIEDNLKDQNFVKDVNIDLDKEILEVKTDINYSPDELAKILTDKVKKNGYLISVNKIQNLEQNKDIIWKALPIGLGFLVIFFLLQKSGILNIGINGKVTPLTSFIVGLIASFSSCLAVVGGLVLSLSTKISQDNVSDKKTFLFFHIGRIASFAILGGFLGVLGGVIGINFTITALLGILASVVMILLGLNLIGIFEKFNIIIPSGVFNFFRRIEHKTFTPIIVGFATFFLPCGFTQSMQVMALSSGSFISGFFIMFCFALGTFPVLALLSFGATPFSNGKYSLLFFKSSGVIVIGFGIFTLISGLVGLGIINPIFNI